MGLDSGFVDSSVIRVFFCELGVKKLSRARFFDILADTKFPLRDYWTDCLSRAESTYVIAKIRVLKTRIAVIVLIEEVHYLYRYGAVMKLAAFLSIWAI